MGGSNMYKVIKKVLPIMLILQFIISMFMVSMPAQAAENLSRMLKTKGNQVVLADDPNVTVRLTGLNVAGAEWTGYPTAENIQRSTKVAFESWDSNIIRLPVSILGWNGITQGKYQSPPDGGKSYRQYIDDVITMASEAGRYVVLDLHHYVGFNDARFLTFWTEAATIYKNNPTVLFGILNEPHDTVWTVWRNGDGNTYKGHQQVVEMIRDLGAKNIIVAGGLDWAYDLRGIVGEAKDDKTIYALIDQGSNGDVEKAGNGIIYDTHIYPWKGHKSDWDSKVGSVRKKYPILIGECGWQFTDSTGNITYPPGSSLYYDKWVPELLAWMNDEKTYGNLANWTGWCFHPTSSPKIIDDPNGTWKETSYAYPPTYYWGTYVKQQLKADLGNNRVTNKIIINSSNGEASFPSLNAIDDNPSTMWVSTATGDKQMVVDLGGNYEISRWIVRHSSSASAITKNFKLQVSDDLTTWTDADVITNNTANITDRFIRPIVGRYVKLYVTKAAQSGNTLRIYEFSVYGDIPTNTVPVAKNLIIMGKPNIGQQLTGAYSYTDSENDIENGSTLKWIAADDAAFTTNVRTIKTEDNTTSQAQHTYILSSSEQGKFVRISVIPRNAAATRVEGFEAISLSTIGIGALSANMPAFMIDNAIVTSINCTHQKYVSGKVTFVNTDASTHDVILMMGRYANNRLVNLIVCSPATIPGCDSDPTDGIVDFELYTPSIETNQLNPGDVLKLFVWDGSNRMQPYTLKKEIIVTGT